MLTPAWMYSDGRNRRLEFVELPYELTNKNHGRGYSWHASAAERKRLDLLFRALGARSPYDVPVVLVLTRVLGRGQRLFDSDSLLRGNSKEIIDAMVAHGWFHDDSPKWIRLTLANQDVPNRATGPKTQIQIWHCEDIDEIYENEQEQGAIFG